METLAELRLREEGRGLGHNQTEAVLGDVERNKHPPGNSELAKQEILAGEQQWDKICLTNRCCAGLVGKSTQTEELM